MLIIRLFIVVTYIELTKVLETIQKRKVSFEGIEQDFDAKLMHNVYNRKGNKKDTLKPETLSFSAYHQTA